MEKGGTVFAVLMRVSTLKSYDARVLRHMYGGKISYTLKLYP